MTVSDSIRVLGLLGFKERLGTYQSYQVVPFVGTVIMLCLELQHPEKHTSVYLFRWHQQVPDNKRKRVQKFMDRKNRSEMDKARAHFPELDSLVEVAHTLEVCP